jgi:RNase H-fold protein (predicted Holliday junction resolvase)
MILGFDPGRDKCGIAVMARDRNLVYQKVIPSSQALATMSQLCQQYPIQHIVLGNQTTSQMWLNQIKSLFSDDLIAISLVDERNSSLEARDRYWQLYPPQGLAQLIPQGMRIPPRPVDDIVAILLIERFLKQ